jgi:trk system potassium uptake protein
MTGLFPALNVYARVLFAFSFAFLVPLAWALGEDRDDSMQIWGGAFALAAGSAAWLSGWPRGATSAN